MGLSYALMLIAFYVDNGKNLPVWKHHTRAAYWFVPSVVGVYFLVRVLLLYRRFGLEKAT